MVGRVLVIIGQERSAARHFSAQYEKRQEHQEPLQPGELLDQAIRRESPWDVLFDAARAPAPWIADRLHGRALATMGLTDWKAALVEIDAAITQRRRDFDENTCKCHGVVEMRLTKAIILDRLGRAKEAQAERQLAAGETRQHATAPTNIEKSGVPVGVFYDRLKRIRLARWGDEK